MCNLIPLGLLLIVPERLQPNEHGDVVAQILGTDTTVGGQELAELMMHGVDMLHMLSVFDFGLMVVGVIRSIGGKNGVAVAVIFKILAGNLVVVCQELNRFLVGMLAHSGIQHLLIHKPNTGNSGVKRLVAVLHHAEHAGLILRRPGNVVGTTIVGLPGHVVFGTGSLGAGAKLTLHMVALEAEGNQHFVHFHGFGHLYGFKILLEYMEKLVTPTERALIRNTAFVLTVFKGVPGKGQFDVSSPGVRGLLRPCKRRAGSGNEGFAALLALIPTGTITLATTCGNLAHRSIGATVGTIGNLGVFNQVVAATGGFGVLRLFHKVHNLVNQFRLLTLGHLAYDAQHILHSLFRSHNHSSTTLNPIPNN